MIEINHIYNFCIGYEQLYLILPENPAPIMTVRKIIPLLGSIPQGQYENKPMKMYQSTEPSLNIELLFGHDCRLRYKLLISQK